MRPLVGPSAARYFSAIYRYEPWTHNPCLRAGSTQQTRTWTPEYMQSDPMSRSHQESRHE